MFQTRKPVLSYPDDMVLTQCPCLNALRQNDVSPRFGTRRGLREPLLGETPEISNGSCSICHIFSREVAPKIATNGMLKKNVVNRDGGGFRYPEICTVFDFRAKRMDLFTFMGFSLIFSTCSLP